MGRGYLLAAWLGVVIAVPAWATVMYDIQRLDVPAGVGAIDYVRDMDVNDAGKIIASVQNGPAAHALVWNPGQPTGTIALSRGGWTHMMVALNNVGRGVIGTYRLDDNLAMWSADGSFALGPMAEGDIDRPASPIDVGIWTSYFQAWDINDHGAIVGGVETPEWAGSEWSGPMYRPVLIDTDGHVHVLASERERQAIVTSINNHGQMAGMARVVENNMPWQFGLASWMIWPSLDQMAPPTTEYGIASDINDRGQIVGMITGWLRDPVILNPDGTMRVLSGRIGGEAIALGQNELDVVVGQFNFLFSQPTWIDVYRAFVDRPDIGTRLLQELIDPALGWDNLQKAFAVNESGQIVGVGEYGGELSLFLATPIPEPGVCLAGVFAGAWWLGRRQRAMEA